MSPQEHRKKLRDEKEKIKSWRIQRIQLAVLTFYDSLKVRKLINGGENVF